MSEKTENVEAPTIMPAIWKLVTASFFNVYEKY